MKSKRNISLLMSAILFFVMTSCASDPIHQTETSDTSDAATDETGGYDYPALDLEGYEFKVLNFDDFYNCYMHLDLTEQTGETIDDAVWTRNRKVEDKLNFKFCEVIETYSGKDWNENNKVAEKLQQSVLADDDLYDAAYTGFPFATDLITAGYFVDLNTIPELKLDNDYWDTALNRSTEINGKLFGATSPLHLSSWGLTWTLLFNKEMVDSYGLASPYTLVRDGKWTLDSLNTYLSTMTNLNGDTSFTFKGDGNAVYGISAHSVTGVYMMIIGSNNFFIGRDNDGKLILKEADERLFNTVDKLASIMGTADGKATYSNADSLTDPESYYAKFANGRAPFLTTELKGTVRLREVNVDYGILPAPKLDENQTDYVTYVSENIHRLVIPTTNDNLSRTGVILDALSYESAKSVLPLYYNQTISLKGLRDEESIEMLEIISKTRICEIGRVFGLTTALIDRISEKVRSGNSDIASIFESQKTAVEGKIQTLTDSVSA